MPAEGGWIWPTLPIAEGAMAEGAMAEGAMAEGAMVDPAEEDMEVPRDTMLAIAARLKWKRLVRRFLRASPCWRLVELRRT